MAAKEAYMIVVRDMLYDMENTARALKSMRVCQDEATFEYDGFTVRLWRIYPAAERHRYSAS
jgi:hypothetical protein